jgi:hypothetical protein
MTVDSNTTQPEEPKSPPFGIGSLLFAIVLAFLVFLLVASMARHRFFRGGHPHRITMTQPQALIPA